MLDCSHLYISALIVVFLLYLSCSSDQTRVFIAPASPRVNRDFSGSVNPQFYSNCVEASTSKVVGSLLHSERIEVQIGDIPLPPFVEDTVEVPHSLPQERPQQRTVDQEQIMAEETTLNI